MLFLSISLVINYTGIGISLANKRRTASAQAVYTDRSVKTEEQRHQGRVIGSSLEKKEGKNNNKHKKKEGWTDLKLEKSMLRERKRWETLIEEKLSKMVVKP